MFEDKRIYVVVTKNTLLMFNSYAVDKLKEGTQVMPCGKAAAQVAHAVSIMRLKWNDRKHSMITTIVLSCRNPEELSHLRHYLNDKGVVFHAVYDNHEEFFGTDKPVMTALATTPITAERGEELFGYLPLWNCGCGQ